MLRACTATCLMALITPMSASAGSYTVSSCRAGWSPEVQRAPGEDGPNADDYCDLPEHGLFAGFTGTPTRLAAGDYAGWRFDAPADTTLVKAVVRWNGLGDYGAVDRGGVYAKIDSSTRPGSPRWDQFDITDILELLDASWVRVSLVCEPASSGCRRLIPPVDFARFFVRASTITLADRFAPSVQAVGGAAVLENTWTGSEPLTFSATDRGGGLFRVIVEADGVPVKAVPAVADDRCVDRTGTRDFGYPVPCPTQGAGSVSIDAADLPSGPHIVGVYLEDVAGNRTALVAPSQRLIVNDYRAVGYYADGRFFNPRFATPRVANGAGAISGARLTASFVRQVGRGRARHSVRAAKREVRFSQRPTVKGTLTAPSGEPIADATVFIGQQPEGQRWRLDGAVHTDSAGDFVYRPAARHPNRQLRAVYFPFSDSHENVATDPLTLRVRAGLTLHVDRHRLRNGQRLIFTGRVLGVLPAEGIAVTLQAKVGRHYRSFRQLRASSRTDGRIRTAYRFERTTGPVRYRFRLKVVRQAGLPFQGGVSPVVSVLVRP
jgi:hypothetical protein